MVYHPPQCSEREPDGVYEDCTWATGVMLANAAAGYGKHPSTVAEFEALRAASGVPLVEGQGNNYLDLAKGMKNRYGLTINVVTGATFAEAWALFKPGIAMGWQGWMGSVTDWLRRWDTGFRAGHSVLGIRDDTSARGWWMNPLAPNTYAGEYASQALFQTYYQHLPGARVAWLPVHTAPPPASNWVMHVAAGATVLIAHISNGEIAGWTTQTWGPAPSSAPCQAPVVLSGTVSGASTVTYVTAGVFAGHYIHVGNGVTVTPA